MVYFIFITIANVFKKVPFTSLNHSLTQHFHSHGNWQDVYGSKEGRTKMNRAEACQQGASYWEMKEGLHHANTRDTLTTNQTKENKENSQHSKPMENK